MAKDLMTYLERKKPRKFQPRPYYGRDEDSLTFYFNNAESYARRVDELLTLFLSLKTEELVGFQVKGVRKNLKRLGGFGIAIKHGKIRCGLFFHLLAFLGTWTWSWMRNCRGLSAADHDHYAKSSESVA